MAQALGATVKFEMCANMAPLLSFVDVESAALVERLLNEVLQTTEAF